MKYEKNQYTDGLSVCGFIIAGIFIWWGVSWLLDLNWFGLIWLGIAAAIIVGQIVAFANRKKLRTAVLFEFEENPKASLDEISRSTGISRKDVQGIILDLKASGQLRGKFSSTTGEMTHALIDTAPDDSVDSGTKYCPTCGTAKSKDTAVFCSYCGTKF